MAKAIKKTEPKKDKNVLSSAEILAMMKSEFKGETSKLLSDEDVGTVKNWIDMGVCTLNYVFTGELEKGFPFGRVAEFYGDESVGKTLIALNCVANAQKQNAIINYFDPECSLDRQFARKLGVNPEEIIYNDSLDTVEQLEQELEKIIKVKELTKTEQPVLAVLDSLGIISTAHEMESPDKNDMTKAKKMKQLTRRLTRKLAKLQIGFFIINHTYAVISTTPTWGGPKKTTGGGTAVHYLASLRGELKIIRKIKDKRTNEKIGQEIKIICTKNKLSRPFREATFIFDFTTSTIGRYSGLAELLANKEIMSKCKIGIRNAFEYKGEKFLEKDFGDLIEKNKWIPEFNAALKEYDEKNPVTTTDSDTVVIEEPTEEKN